MSQCEQSHTLNICTLRYLRSFLRIVYLDTVRLAYWALTDLVPNQHGHISVAT